MNNSIKGERIVLSDEELEQQAIQEEFDSFIRLLKNHLSKASNFDHLSGILEQALRETNRVKKDL